MSTTPASRLAIGTAQFGMAYGIANRTGEVAGSEAGAILRAARAAGIDTIDTAAAYGASERRLGELDVAAWQVVTKLPHMPHDVADVEAWVERSLDESLARLRCESVAGLLVHRATDLTGPRGHALAAGLRRQRESGRARMIGVSIYDPGELESVYQVFEPDIVQAPLNCLDARLETSGWLRRLHDRSAQIHVRSVFLQGLLLLADGARPPAFERWNSTWRSWAAWTAQSGASPLEAALGHALAHPEVSRVIVGVDSLPQLEQIVAATARVPERAPAALIATDVDLIDPSRWAAL